MDYRNFFDEHTMSVHLKAGSTPVAKRGTPGKWTCVELSTTPLASEELTAFIDHLVTHREGLKHESDGSFIIQRDGYRMVGTKPPLSTAPELTIVKQLKHRTLDQLECPDTLKKRLLERSEGIIIAGSPGEGKSTLAQAIITFLAEHKNIIKTIEHPRDLIVPPGVAQYSLAHAQEGELHDVLLLSRPDYSVFDELRKPRDFALFVDLRLAGIGMIGVVHASSPLDAIARFVGRIELGMIPQIIDRVVFVKGGTIVQQLSLTLDVGVPEGLQTDLARPMVVIRDTATELTVAQLYAFGNENVLMPVKCHEPKTSVQIETNAEPKKEPPKHVSFEMNVQEKLVTLHVDPALAETPLNIVLDSTPLARVLVSKKGTIKMNSDSPQAKALLDGVKTGKRIVLESC